MFDLYFNRILLIGCGSTYLSEPIFILVIYFQKIVLAIW